MLGSDWHARKQKVYNRPSNKSDLRSHHDKLASSRPSHAIRKSIGINSGPRITTTPDRRDTIATDPRLTCNAVRPISDRPTTWARLPRVTGLARQKFAWEKKFMSDLRPIYDRFEWHARPPSDLRPTCEDLRPQEDPAASWVTRKWNWQVLRPFLTVKSDRGACRFQWRVCPSYCEYSGVIYDLLVSNMGGTYNLADQLTSLFMFFGRKPVLSPSGVRCKSSIKHADIKGVRQRLTTTASLDDGYWEATIPVVMGYYVT